MTMLACAAGKDVYVEKPLTLFVREGRWMVQIAQRYKRVVQVGTPAAVRGRLPAGPHAAPRGAIGADRFRAVQFFPQPDARIRQSARSGPAGRPGLGHDARAGPAAPVQPQSRDLSFPLVLGLFRRTSTNLGHHSLDVVHWCLDVKGPKAVSSAGGRYFLKDNCEVPDVQDVILEYPGFTTVCQYRECTTGHGGAEMGTLNFLGTKGTLPLTRQGYEVFPDPKQDPIDQVARILGGHPIGGPQAKTGDGPPQFWTEGAKNLSGDAMLLYTLHARNFLECIRSRREPGLGPGERPSGGDRLPPGQPVSPHGPQDPMGRREGDRRRCGRLGHVGSPVSQTLGCGTSRPRGRVVRTSEVTILTRSVSEENTCLRQSERTTLAFLL